VILLAAARVTGLSGTFSQCGMVAVNAGACVVEVMMAG
jgi:hypothetical protein